MCACLTPVLMWPANHSQIRKANFKDTMKRMPRLLHYLGSMQCSKLVRSNFRSGSVTMSELPVTMILVALCALVSPAVRAFCQTPAPTPAGKALEAQSLQACAQAMIDQLALLKIPDTRGLRFQGKVSEATALCRGGEQALQFRGTPWVDWSNYWGTGDMTSLPTVCQFEASCPARCRRSPLGP